MKPARFNVSALSWATAIWSGRLSIDDLARKIVEWTRKGWKAAWRA